MKKSKLKIILIIFSMTIFLFGNISLSFAHELISGKRWQNQTTYSGKKYLYLNVKTTYLNDSWRSAGTTGRNNWGSYSGSYVRTASTTSPNVECASCTKWFWFMPKDGIAVTNIRDTNGIWLWSFNGDGFNNSIGNLINYAHIYTNPAGDSLESIKKILL